MDVNVLSVFWITQCFLEDMLELGTTRQVYYVILVKLYIQPYVIITANVFTRAVQICHEFPCPEVQWTMNWVTDVLNA